MICIRAKKEQWSIEGLKLEVDKQMSKHGPRKIDTLIINIDLPSNLADDQLKVLKKEIKDCPVMRNIQCSTKIILLCKHQ